MHMRRLPAGMDGPTVDGRTSVFLSAVKAIQLTGGI